MRYTAPELKSLAALAVKYSGLKLFERHNVSQLLWGYQPKFPIVIESLLKKLNMIPTWGIFVGVITLKFNCYTDEFGDLLW